MRLIGVFWRRFPTKGRQIPARGRDFFNGRERAAFYLCGYKRSRAPVLIT